jgi:mono/diheme cytochrome c family protein
MLKSKFKVKGKRQKVKVWGSQFKQAGSRSAFYLFTFTFCLIFAVGCRQDMQDQPRYEVYESSTFFKNGLSSRPLVEGTVARGYLRNDTEFYTGKIDRSRTNPAGGATAAPAQNPNGRMTGDDGAQTGGQTTSPQGTLDNQGAGTAGGNTMPAGGAAGAGNGGGGGGGGGGAANQAGGSIAQGDPNDVETFPFPVTGELVNRGQERYRIFCAMCHGETGAGDGMIVRRGFRKPPSYHTPELRAARVGHLFDVITNGWGSMPNYAQQVPARDRWAIIAYIRALQLSQGTGAEGAKPPTPQAGGTK